MEDDAGYRGAGGGRNTARGGRRSVRQFRPLAQRRRRQVGNRMQPETTENHDQHVTDGVSGASSTFSTRSGRQRREKMGDYYAALQDMVPNLFPRATKARIIEETIAYIRELQESLSRMEAAKRSAASSSSSSSPSVPPQMPQPHKGRRVLPTQPPVLEQRRIATIHVAAATRSTAGTVFFGVRSVKRPGLVSRALQIFEKHRAEVLTATVASAARYVDFTFTVAAHQPETEVLEMLKQDLYHALST